MGILITYSLLASIISVALFPVIYILVRRCTSYGFNRHAIVAAVMISLLLPPAFMFSPVDTMLMEVGTLNIVSPSEISTDTIQNTTQHTPFVSCILPVVVVVYYLGVLFMSVRECASYLRLSFIISRSERLKENYFTICKADYSARTPFSWGKYIVLPSNEDIDDAILKHEKAHVYHRHWIDLMLIDILCIVTWFNPFAWIIRQFMKLNHEYEADSDVVSTGIDVTSYQRLLVINAIGGRGIHVANNFRTGFKDFRRRVLAMKRPVSKKHMWKSVVAIPALGLVAVLLSLPVSAKIISTLSGISFIQNDIIHPAKHQEDSPQPIAAPMTVLDSPVENPDDLLTTLSVTFQDADIKGPVKARLIIKIDKDGKVENVETFPENQDRLTDIVKDALMYVQFRHVLENGTPVETQFSIPVNIRP